MVLSIGLIVFVAACATQTSEVAESDVQAALVQAGFKAKPATTAGQQQHLQSRPEHQFVAVREKGKKSYPGPTSQISGSIAGTSKPTVPIRLIVLHNRPRQTARSLTSPIPTDSRYR